MTPRKLHARRTRDAPRPRLADARLLRLALVPGASTLEDWEALQPDLDFDDLRARDAIRLLPLVHRTLAEGGLDGSQASWLEGIVRQAWFENTILLDRVASALRVLEAAGVRSLALKGLPLALSYYPHPRLRPMADVDLLVDTEAAPKAIRALRDAGWTPEWPLGHDFTARFPEIPLRSPDGHAALDLHWRLVPWVDRDGAGADDALWSAARPLVVGDTETLAPAPDDLLLHVLLHAYRSGWDRVPRWVADTVVLLRVAGNEVDWDRFVHRVLTAHLALPVSSGLAYASRAFDAAVPERVLTALEAVPSSRRERHKHRVASQSVPAHRHWLLGDSRALRIGWARASVNLTRRGSVRTLPPFLRRRFGVDHLSALPVSVFARRIPRSIRGRRARA